MIHNLPEGFEFAVYESVWSYYGTAQGRPDFQVDIFARPKADAFARPKADAFAHAANAVALIGEIKNRDNAPFTAPEAQAFREKMATLQQLEHVTDAIGFVYSRSGFTTPALDFLREHRIAYSDDVRWWDE